MAVAFVLGGLKNSMGDASLPGGVADVASIPNNHYFVVFWVVLVQLVIKKIPGLLWGQVRSDAYVKFHFLEQFVIRNVFWPI